jgi:hypothetical protein
METLNNMLESIKQLSPKLRLFVAATVLAVSLGGMYVTASTVSALTGGSGGITKAFCEAAADLDNRLTQASNPEYSDLGVPTLGQMTSLKEFSHLAKIAPGAIKEDVQTVADAIDAFYQLKPGPDQATVNAAFDRISNWADQHCTPAGN